jgi:hypothetical protein
MGLVTARYFSNAIVGTPSVGADVNVTEVHATPRFAIGTGFTRADGARFRYGCCTTGVAAGSLVAPQFSTSGVVYTANAVIAPASAVAVSGEPIAPGKVGSRYLEITLATVSKNQFAGGYLVIADGGYTYRIEGNTATDDPATGNIRIKLKEKLVVVLAATTDVIIVPCLWNDVILASNTDAAVCGVAMGTTVTTTYPFGWFCTRGIVGTLQAAAWGTGLPIARQGGTAGSAALWTTVLGVSSIPLGYGITAGTAAGYGAAYIQID